MARSSIQFKTYTALLLIALATLTAGATMMHMVERIKEDTDVVVALDRQRMLTQIMAKSALGYVMAKSGYQTMEERVRILDTYMTQVRQTALNPPPDSGRQGSGCQQPDLFLQQVNAAFEKKANMELTFLAERPLNPQHHLQDDTDWQALSWLKKQPERIFGTSTKEARGMMLRFYTADRATDPSCFSCHTPIAGLSPADGTILGLRRYLFLFSGDIALGKAELEPSLSEYYLSRDLFKATLSAVRLGGILPMDMEGHLQKEIPPLKDQVVQTRMETIQEQFDLFTQTAQSLFMANLGSESYRKARQAIPEQSNRLRTLSDDLVRIHTGLLHREKEGKILWITSLLVVLVLSIILTAAWTIRRTILNPLAALHATMEEMASGNLQVRVRILNEKDEIGQMGQAFNQMTENLASMVRNMHIHSSSLTAMAAELVNLEKTMGKNLQAGSALNRQAMGWMNEMEGEIQQNATEDSPIPPERVAKLLLYSDRVMKTMTEALKLAQINHGTLDHARMLTGIFNEISQALGEAEQGLITGHTPFDIGAVKRAYLQWFGQWILAMQNGDSPTDLSDIEHSHPSAFGVWYQTQGREKFGHMDVFKELGALHEQARQTAAQIIPLRQTSHPRETLRQMAGLNRIRRQLFGLLDQLYAMADQGGLGPRHNNP